MEQVIVKFMVHQTAIKRNDILTEQLILVLTTFLRQNDYAGLTLIGKNFSLILGKILSVIYFELHNIMKELIEMPKSKLKSITTENLIEIIHSSSSFEEALQKIGYKSQFNNTLPKLKEECDLREIDYKHLLLPDGQKRCLQCGQIKFVSDFYDKRQICKECTKENERIKYHKKKEQVIEYKSGLRCKKCGENRFYLLDFHHLDPSQKDYTISHNSRIKFENLMKEIDKCILLCSNCHREFHYLEREEGITIEDYLEGWQSG